MSDDDGRDEPLDGPGYAEAVLELEGILAELEDDDVDVDVLAERVARASELVRVCRRRIDAARFQVDRIVAELAEPAAPPRPPSVPRPAGDAGADAAADDPDGDPVADAAATAGAGNDDDAVDGADDGPADDGWDGGDGGEVIPAYDEPDVDGVGA